MPGLGIFWLLTIIIQIIRFGIALWKLLSTKGFTLITE